MEVEEKWTEKDFDVMGWHDSRIHSISFPQGELELKFDIDYIFKWVLDQESGRYRFWVSPCTLTFSDVITLKIDLTFDHSVGLDIQDITRRNPTLPPNGEPLIWDYVVETDKGLIVFGSSGFLQQVRKQPVFTESQSLSRIG